MGVEAFGNEWVFEGVVFGGVPEVVVFPGVVFEVEEFADAFAVVDDELVGASAKRGWLGQPLTAQKTVRPQRQYPRNQQI